MPCLSDVEIAKVASCEKRLPAWLRTALRQHRCTLADVFIQDAVSRGHRPDVERIKLWVADEAAHETRPFVRVVGETAKSEDEIRERRARRAEARVKAESERARSIRRPIVFHQPERI